MGSLFNNVCYPSAAQAQAASCSQTMVNGLSGSDFVSTSCTAATESGFSLCTRINGGACTTVSHPWPDMPACDFSGGVSLSYDYFLVAITLLCLVWGGKQLIKLFDQHHTES